MVKAYVLMTAMPPTKGHLHLIQFAAQVGDTAEVILATQPDEPYSFERLAALRAATQGMNVNIHHIHQTLPQEPEGGGFWDMWVGFLKMFGLHSEDYIVGSEMYGAKLAELTGTVFIPYDIDRGVYFTKATPVREDPLQFFDWILPEFQSFIRQRITIFGAESTGKTTLSKQLATALNGYWLPEWARPYLENVTPDVTPESMHAIWKGQYALQESAKLLQDKPFIFQDTDLVSTVGYWDYMDGNTPMELSSDAWDSKSDLYIITQSNIPFEKDPLRYGGDHREIADSTWLRIAQEFQLNYVVLAGDDKAGRFWEATNAVYEHWNKTVHMDYDRKGQ